MSHNIGIKTQTHICILTKFYNMFSQWNHTAHMDRELPLYVLKLAPPQGNILVTQVHQLKFHYK